MSESTTPAAQAPRKVVARLLEGGQVLHLLIDNPKGNVLSLEVMEALRAALVAHRTDPAFRHLRAVFLQGANGQFSFGASVEEHRPAQAAGMLAGFHALIREMAEYPTPIVALVEGRCLGGAFEVILACHFVMATNNAQLGCPEIRLGVFPPVLAALGPIRLGGALSERLMLTGDTIGVEGLERCGVLTTRLPDSNNDDVLQASLTWYRRTLAGLSAFALRQTTQAARKHPVYQMALHGALDALERQYVEQVVPSHDGTEGIAAFIDRRSPRWEDT